MKQKPNIIQFAKRLCLPLSLAQMTLLKSMYGLPLNTAELGVFTACTGRSEYVPTDYPEVTAVCGARSGKDSMIATPMALYEAVFGQHEKHLAPGEQAIIACVAQDRRGANILRGYILGLIEATPWLKELVIGDPTQDEIKFKNRVSIACFPSTMRSMRGWSIPCSILDELAFFRWEGAADSDVEIQTALRRGGINFPRTKLLKISTPYLRTGILADDYKDYYAVDSRDVLVWKAPSVLMNPTLRTERMAREQRLGGERYLREYEAEFLDDAAGFLKGFWIDSAIKPGVRNRPPRPAAFRYISVVDQSGLRTDEFTHVIGHMEQDVFVEDYLRAWRATGAEFSDLDAVVKSIADVSRQYGCAVVIGDQSSEAWVGQKFAEHKMAFQVSQQNTNECYLASEVYFAVGKIDLLDDPQQTRQLKLLEKTQRPGGRTSVSHPRGQHDDMAAALCRAVANSIVGVVNASDLQLVGTEKMTKRSAMWDEDDRNNGSSVEKWFDDPRRHSRWNW